MKLDINHLRNIFRKCLFYKDFLEKYNAENLQDFAQTQLDLEFFLDNRGQNVNADGYPNLGFHGVLGSSEKSLPTNV